MIYFPLYSLVDGQCGCGNKECEILGKHPPYGWNKASDETPPALSSTQGAGILTGAKSGIFVVDLDVKPDRNGYDSLRALGEAPPTYAVKTPTGGAHLYFKHPGFPVRNSGPKTNPIGPGIDIRGDGGYVVAPGSPHKNGGRYFASNALPIAEAPSWLLSWPGLRHSTEEVSQPAEEIEKAMTSVPRDWRIARAKAWAEKQPAAIEGSGGDGHTWSVLVRAVHEFCLTDADMIADALAEWNSRCQPPWTGKEWAHKVDDALHKSTMPWKIMEATAEYKDQQLKPQPDSLAAKLIETEKPGCALAWETGGLDAELPPIDFWIDSLIARGDVVMLVAHGNSLKTWLAFSFAHALASGRPWLGKYPTKRGRVGILDFESGRYEVMRRLKLLGVKDADVEDRLMRASYPALDLSKPETWLSLAESNLDALIVDSFNGAAPTEDENDARAARMLQYAGRFAEYTGCIVIVIHHARKGSGGDEREAVRGSTALYAACDRVFKFSEPEKKEGGLVITSMKSIKDGAGRSPADIRVELSDQGLRWVEPSAKQDERPTAERNMEIVMNRLKAQPAGVPKADLLNVLIGTTAARREFLSSLKLAETIKEYAEREGKARTVYVRINEQ